MDDAFGGFTEGMLQLLREDFPKTPIMTYGLQSSNMPVKEVSIVSGTYTMKLMCLCSEPYIGSC